MTKQDRSPSFPVGTNVIHANHGVGKIIGMINMVPGGSGYHVTFPREKLTLQIPTQGSGIHDLQLIPDNNRLPDIFRVLGGKQKNDGRMWAQREKDLRNKLNSGNILSLCEVVRDLYVPPDEEMNYSARTLYDKTLTRILDILMVMLEVSEEAVIKRLNRECQTSARVFEPPYQVRKRMVPPTTAVSSPFDPARHRPTKTIVRIPSAEETRWANRETSKPQATEVTKPETWTLTKQSGPVVIPRQEPDPKLIKPQMRAKPKKVAAAPTVPQPQKPRQVREAAATIIVPPQVTPVIPMPTATQPSVTPPVLPAPAHAETVSEPVAVEVSENLNRPNQSEVIDLTAKLATLEEKLKLADLEGQRAHELLRKLLDQQEANARTIKQLEAINQQERALRITAETGLRSAAKMEDYKKIQADTEVLRRSLQGARAGNTRLKNSSGALKKRLRATETENLKLQEEVARLSQLTSVSDLEAAQATIALLETNISTLQAERDEAHRAKAGIERSLHICQSIIANHDQDLQIAKAEFQELVTKTRTELMTHIERSFGIKKAWLKSTHAKN